MQYSAWSGGSSLLSSSAMMYGCNQSFGDITNGIESPRVCSNSSSNNINVSVARDRGHVRTLSAARMRKLSMTCSAVSVSVDSRVMKSRNASKCT